MFTLNPFKNMISASNEKTVRKPEIELKKIIIEKSPTVI
jgi:hypothetical protein